MRSIDEHIAWVNKEVEFQERRAVLTEAQGGTFKAAKHKELADNLQSILADLEAALERAKQAESAPVSSSQADTPLSTAIPDGDVTRAVLGNPLYITPHHLKGLPAELLAQISISETDRFEANVAYLVGSAVGSTMLLDNILIGLYLMTKETHQRQQLANKLYRMTKKGLLFGVPGKKGYYTTIKPDGDIPQQDGAEEED